VLSRRRDAVLVNRSVSLRQRSPWTSGPDPGRHFRRRLLIVIACFALLVLAASWAFPPGQMRDGDDVNLVGLVLLAAVVIVGAAASRQRLSDMAVQFGVWGALMLLIVAVHAYRFELTDLGHRVMGELAPTRGRTLDADTISFARAVDRQFWIDAMVDGGAIRLLVDTGASSVVLTKADAQRLGFRLDQLRFTQTFRTANGSTRGASIRLDHVVIGPIAFDNVEAWVNEGDLGNSLLGISLLERLGSVEIRNDTLTIRR
jgi:aspartyl protease family protein